MRRTTWLLGLLMFMTMSSAFAQDRTQRLQQEVDDLKATVKALQTEVQALKAERAPPLTAAAPSNAATAPLPGAAPQAIAPATQVPSTQVDALELTHAERSPLPPQQSVSEDQDSASRPDNEAPPTNPDLKGFMRIPGTETLVRLGGYAKLDAIDDIHAIGYPDAFVTSTIPIPRPHDDAGNFTMQARQTRLSMEIRRPTIFDESLRFYFETDLFGGGAGNYGFRLRQAYGQLGNTFAGFGWSAFDDLDALPDTLDFEGPPGAIAPRQAGIHQFFRLSENTSLTVAAEQPASQVSASSQASPDVIVNGVHATQHLPDVILAARTEGSWGHLQVGGVLRQLGYTDFQQSDRTLAGGAQLSGSFKIGAFAPYSDLLMFSAGWGKGIARYLSDTGGLNLDALVGPDGKLHTLTGLGAHIAYTHYWSSNWRSNLVYGIARIQHSPLLVGGDYHSAGYGAANVIWSPVATFTAGIELLHGRFEVQDDRYNTDTRIQGSIQYSFIK